MEQEREKEGCDWDARCWKSKAEVAMRDMRDAGKYCLE